MPGASGDVNVAIAITGQYQAGGAFASATKDLSGLDSAAGSALGTLGKFAAGAAAGGIIGLGAGIVGATKSAGDFEKTLSAIGAVGGKEAVDRMGELQSLALQIGKDTKFSAGEAAAGMEELIKAGVSVNDVMGGAATATANLAAAGGVDLAFAAEVASNSLNTFGEVTRGVTMNAGELAKVADIMAGAANASAIDIGDLKFSMSAAGAVANQMGFSLQETAAAVAVLGQNGIKGSDAGTSLKTMMTSLVPATDKASAVMQQLGIVTLDSSREMEILRNYGIDPTNMSAMEMQGTLYDLVTGHQAGTKATKEQQKAWDDAQKELGIYKNQFFDAEGNVKSFDQVAQILQDTLGGLGTEDQVKAIKDIFGADAQRAASIFVKTGAQGFNDMAAAMDKVTAKDVAEQRLKGLNGVIEQLQGSFETAAITVGMAFLPAVTKMSQGVLDAFNGIMPALDIASRALAGFIETGDIRTFTTTLAEALGFDASPFLTALDTISGMWQQFVMGLAGESNLELFSENGPLITGANAIGLAFGALAGVWTGTVAPALAQVGELIGGNLGPIMLGMAAMVGAVVVPAFIAWAAAAATAAVATVVAMAPVVVPILLIGAAVAGLAAAWQNNWFGIRDVTAQVVGVLVTVVGSFLAGVSDLWEKYGGTISAAAAKLWDGVGAVTTAAMNVIDSIVTTTLGAISSLWETHGATISAIASALWTTLVAVVSTGFEAMVALFTASLQLMSGDWSGAWTTMSTFLTDVWTQISANLLLAWTAITEAATAWLNAADTGLVGLLNLAWTAIATAATELWTVTLPTMFTTAWTAITTGLTTWLTGEGGVLPSIALAWDTLLAAAGVFWQTTLPTMLSAAWATILTTLTAWLGAGAEGAGTILGAIALGWTNLLTAATTFWQTTLPTMLAAAWAAMLVSLTAWLTGPTGVVPTIALAWTTITTGVTTGWTAIQAALKLALDTALAAIVATFTGSAGIVPTVTGAWGVISESVGSVLGPAMQKAEGFFNSLKSPIDAVIGLVDKLIGLLSKLGDVIPKELIPHSPPPLAEGLDRVADAARRAGQAISGGVGEALGQIGGGAVADAMSWAQGQIGKRYAGPVIGEPDSYRWGSPGWDCSSFVSAFYKTMGYSLPAFTDAIASATKIPTDPQAGDIILYRYSDPSQPGVSYPHTGIYLGNGKMLDAQFGLGVGVHNLLNRPYEIHRPVSRAMGGWIDEPVVGFGLSSGRTWTFGEREAEYVTPRSRMGGGGRSTVYNINVTAPSPEEAATAVVREMHKREWMDSPDWNA